MDAAAPAPPRVDPQVAARRLLEVLALAEELPYRPARELAYPRLPVPTDR